MADSSGVMQKMVADYRKGTELDEDPPVHDIDHMLAWYNALATRAFFVFSLDRALQRAWAVELLDEQVRIILSIKELHRTSSDGLLPSADKITGLESKVISGAKWEYQLREDGMSFSLKLTKQPKWIKDSTGDPEKGAGFFALPLDGKTFWKLKKISS